MKWRNVWKWALSFLLLALIFFLSDMKELPHLSIRWGVVPGIFFATIGFILFHTIRWKIIVESVSKSKEKSLLTFWNWMIHSYTLSYLMPRDFSLIGVRTYYLKQFYHLSLSLSLFSVTFDRFIDGIIFLYVIFPSLLFIFNIFSPLQSFFYMIISVVLGLLILKLKGKEMIHLLVRVYQKILKMGFIKKWIKSNSQEKNLNNSLDWKRPYSLIIWSFAAYVLLVFRLFFTGEAIGIDLTLCQSFFLLPIIQISGLINLTPANLGILELGSWGALLLIGIPKEQILSFVIGQRILLTSVMFFIILLNHFFFFLRNIFRKSIREN